MSAGRRLAAYVHLYDLNGRPVVLGPSDPVPDWAAARITNPGAWTEEPDTGPQEAAPQDPPGDQRPPLAPPPRGGKGSGEPAWREYAEKLGVQVPAEADREDIIAAVDAAGHPVD